MRGHLIILGILALIAHYVVVQEADYTCFDAKFPMAFGGTDKKDRIKGLESDGVGNVYVCGMTRSANWASTKNLPFVAKVDLNGFFVWGKYYDFPKDLSSATDNISCSMADDKQSLIVAAELNNLKLFAVDLENGSV